MWPLPQRPGLANNWVANPIKRSNIHRGDGRLDHTLSAMNTLFFRFSADWSDMTIPDTFDRTIGGNEASFAGDDTVKGRSLVGAWTHTFNPSTIGDFRYGYTQFNMALLPTTFESSAVEDDPRPANRRSISAVGAHRGHNGLCRIG